LKRGILLLNMGGPNNIDEVELFLRNMFADPNILPMNRYMRNFVANIIIRKRLHEAEENYREIGGRSPLTEITRSLCVKLERRLKMPVRPAMRYVPPFTLDALKEFQAMEIEEIVLFPMYPHYSTTTTRSSVEDVSAQCAVLGYDPEIKVVDPYYTDPTYIDLQIAGIKESLKDRDPAEYELLLSAHGLPLSIIHAGDPYEKQIESNAAILKYALAKEGMDFKSIRLVYQSKVGGGAWLEPNLVDVLRKPQHLKVLIYPLAFTIDNSETIFELDIEHREIAQKIGYQDYCVAKCPNDSDAFMEYIVAQISAV